MRRKRSSLVLSLSTVLSVLAACATGAGASDKALESAAAQCETPSREQTPSAAQPERVEAAIQRATTYFSSRGLEVSKTDVVMLVFLLREHFELAFDFPAVREFHRKYPELARAHFQIYDRYFDGRTSPVIADEEVWKAFRGGYPEQIDALTGWSMYCRQYPLPADYLDALVGKAKSKGYGLTHSALQLQNVLNNGCGVDRERAVALKEDIRTRLVSLMEDGDSKEDVDLRIEAIVMLYYMGFAPSVRPSYVDWLLARQNGDGGWPVSTTSGASHDHTSVLGLWALLEYRQRLPAP